MQDEVFKSTLHYQDHEDILYHQTSQPSENLILSRNAELRKNPGVIKDLGTGKEGGTWGRQVATIPLIMLEKAKRDGYDLFSKDTKHASNEMFRFLQSEDGKKCLVQGN